jgi:outer membrane protein assembly factor BamB
LSGLAMAAAGFSGVTACGRAPATATAATVQRRAPGSLIWRIRAGSGVSVGGNSLTSSVVAAGGMVYAASNVQIPVLANGVLYATTATGIVALNAETGTPLWRSAALTKNMGAVVATEGVVCCSDAVSFSGTPVFALAAATGRLLWHDELAPVRCGASGIIVFSPVPGDAGQSALRARHARTGKPAWERAVQQGFGVMTTLDGVVYYNTSSLSGAGGDDLLHAIDAVSGRPLRAYRVSAPVTGLAGSDGVLYAADAKGNVYAWQA